LLTIAQTEIISEELNGTDVKKTLLPYSILEEKFADLLAMVLLLRAVEEWKNIGVNWVSMNVSNKQKLILVFGPP
jgi:hypothetical protein